MEDATPYTKHAWLAWERLRTVYNLVLLVQGLTCVYFLRELDKIAQHPFYKLGPWWDLAIFFGGVANALYFLGPLTEAGVYRVLGWRMGRARYCLFAAGLLLSASVIFVLASGVWSRMSYGLRGLSPCQ
jgi:hypothetical protein